MTLGLLMDIDVHKFKKAIFIKDFISLCLVKSIANSRSSPLLHSSKSEFLTLLPVAELLLHANFIPYLHLQWTK